MVAPHSNTYVQTREFKLMGPGEGISGFHTAMYNNSISRRDQRVPHSKVLNIFYSMQGHWSVFGLNVFEDRYS